MEREREKEGERERERGKGERGEGASERESGGNREGEGESRGTGGSESRGGGGAVETCSQTNDHLRKERDICELIPRPPCSPPLSFSILPQGVFELLNKNSGLCIKLQFGKTKLSGGIIILISKKKIKPAQIFLDYSALGDLFFPPSSSSSSAIVKIFPTLPLTDT